MCFEPSTKKKRRRRSSEWASRNDCQPRHERVLTIHNEGRSKCFSVAAAAAPAGGRDRETSECGHVHTYILTIYIQTCIQAGYEDRVSTPREALLTSSIYACLHRLHTYVPYILTRAHPHVTRSTDSTKQENIGFPIGSHRTCIQAINMACHS